MSSRSITYKEILKIEEEFGTSGFYIFEESAFRNNMQSFLNAFTPAYRNTALGYSYKTNYSPYICKIAKELGAYAEVVSWMEYSIAKEIGYQGPDIIFNGPYKEYAHLEVAVHDGAIINIDNLGEMNDLAAIAAKGNAPPIKIGVRCNFGIEDNPYSRFGIDVDSEEFKKAYSRMLETGAIEVVGLHCHFSTTTRSLASFSERASKIIDIARNVFDVDSLDYISIGGGYFGNIPETMKNQFKNVPPTFADYAYAITPLFKASFPDERITLMLEPGAALVADTFSYYCKVKDIKTVRNTTYVTVNGSYQNIKPIGQGVNLPIQVISKEKSNTYSNVEVVGYTCMEFDRLHKAAEVEISVGDYVRFSNVGAYTVVLNAPFIKEAPPIFGKNMRDEIVVIKRKATFRDILSTYCC